MTLQFDSRNNGKSLDGPTLKLDDEFDDDEADGAEDSQDVNEDEDYQTLDEEVLSRGRSRSRSMHANDDNFSPEVITPPLDKKITPIRPPSPDLIEKRSGPLQHREVQALRKVIKLKIFI